MIRTAQVAGACIALIACSHQPPSGEPTLVGTIVTESRVAEINEAVTPAMLVGRWGDNGDCAKDIIIGADGGFKSYTDGDGTWALDGNMLTRTTTAGSTLVWVGTIGADQLVFGHQDRTAEVWQRCPQQ